MKKLWYLALLNILIINIFPNLNNAWGQLPFLVNPLIGKPAKSFTLETLSGKKMSLEEFREGKKAIVFFWATWCPHCRQAITKLNGQKDELEKKDIRIILVDIGESKPEVRRYVEMKEIVFDVFLDSDSSVAERYEIIGVPTFYFINKEGIINDVQHELPRNYDQILSKT